MITQNTIKLGTIQSKLANIIPQAEKHLASLNLSPEQTAALHNNFLKQCQADTDTEPRPEIQRIKSKKTPKPTKEGKRKTTGSQPAQKKRKLSHNQTNPTKCPITSPKNAQNSFLSLGPQANSTPT